MNTIARLIPPVAPALRFPAARATVLQSPLSAGRPTLPRQIKAKRHYSQQQPLPQNNRSQFKVLPFVLLVLGGTGLYVLLVRSRASARKAAIERN